MRFLRYFVLVILILGVLSSVTAQETIPVVSQHFEGGEMIYRADTGDIYVISTVSGHWWFLPSTQYGQLPLNQLKSAPDERVAPIMGFGRVWANYSTIRNELGWAILPEVSTKMTFTTLTTGEVYLTQLDGTILQLWEDGIWQTVTTVPKDKDLKITRFEVSPETVNNGEVIHISWEARGSDLVEIIIRDIGNPAMSKSLWDGTPEDGGSWSWVVPETIQGDVEVTLWLVNYANFPTSMNFQQHQWLISETRVVSVHHEPVHIETHAVLQNYEYGFMLWREDTGEIRIFYNGGGWQLIPESTYKDNSDNQWPTPDGCIKPQNAFGRVWGSYGDIRDGIGCATAAEVNIILTITSDIDNSFKYRLSNGREFWLSKGKWWN